MKNIVNDMDLRMIFFPLVFLLTKMLKLGTTTSLPNVQDRSDDFRVPYIFHHKVHEIDALAFFPRKMKLFETNFYCKTSINLLLLSMMMSVTMLSLMLNITMTSVPSSTSAIGRI